MKNPNDNKDLLWENAPIPELDDERASKDYYGAYEANEKKLQALDAEAEKRGCMQGRVIYEGFADGAAIYQVIKENKKTCRIRQVSIGGDDWTIPYWGKEATVNKGFVINKIIGVGKYAPKFFVDGYGQKWE